MTDSGKKERCAGPALWTILAVAAAVAVGYVVVRRMTKGESPLDADAILAAADKAASRLDAILLSEGQAAS
ncbi:MAG TPA: hypothetical protein VNI20_05655 [Fimbriimonadaceae bacterium]|nr:hypothetical protein [Fimbriimonadaceae bacterium]